MAAVEGWSELPRELLDLISQRIDTEIDLLRFRSVCSNWRSFSIPNHFYPPFKVPLFKHPFSNDDIIPAFFVYLSKRCFFLVKPPQQEDQGQQPWLIRITQTSTGTAKLSQGEKFHVLDFNNLSVLHLGCEFLVENTTSFLSNFLLPKSVYVVTCHGKKPLTLFLLKDHPFMLLFRATDENFLSFPNVSTSVRYLCVFKQRIYLVYGDGKTDRVGFEEYPNVQVAAEPLVDSGNLKFLLENEGDLLLVDIDDRGIELKIHVFRLDENERKWVKFENLGGRVLFVGLELSFSASVSDLHVPKGNCIIFIDDVFDHMNIEDMSIVHLDQNGGHLSVLHDNPEYCSLFWPPPEWIVKSHLR